MGDDGTTADRLLERYWEGLLEVEPLLHATCTHEVDATQPLAAVVQQLIETGHEEGDR